MKMFTKQESKLGLFSLRFGRFYLIAVFTTKN